MSDLGELYQQLILDHNARPRNFGALENATHRAEGYNPLCGDQLSIGLIVDSSDCIQDVRFTCKGCAISKASASLMTLALKGKSRTEVEALFDRFHSLVTNAQAPMDDSLGKLTALAGVREFPMRVKCATLAWHTLRAALDQVPQKVSTE